ncbi:MAG: phosphoribosylanthranilate isomerase [Planctomycetaceae bacterium]
MWIKICGITNPEDAAVACDAGADAVGLNFFPGSRRFVDASRAARIRRGVGDRAEVIGVFVNSSADEICRVVGDVGLTGVQFHGDEPPDLIAAVQNRLPGTRLIRAIRVDSDGSQTVDRHLEQLADRGVVPDAILVDAFVAGEFGGTGKRVDANLLRQSFRENWPPLILAGGLTPENVESAITEVRPWGVDTASGVETSPGKKSPEKVKAFLEAARAANCGDAVR